MKKAIIGLCVVALIAVFAGRAWYLQSQKKVKPEANNGDVIVKVGLLTHPSGVVAKMGQEILNGALLAKEEINASDDYNGRKIEMFVGDSQIIPKIAISEFNRLLFKDIVAAVIAGDNAVPAVAPLVKNNKIPSVVTISYNNEFLKSNDPKYMYKNFLTIEKLYYALSRRAIELFGIKKVAIYAINLPFGKEAIKGIQDGLKGTDVEITHIELYPEDERDCKDGIAKVLASKPEAVFVAGYGMGYPIGINRLREAGFKGKILSSPTFKDAGFKEYVKTDENIVFVQQFDNLNEKNSPFAIAYKKRFGEDPTDFSTFGYSSMKLMGEAIKNAKTLDKEGIHEALDAIKKFETPFGTLTLNEDGSCDLTLILAETKGNGKYEVLEVIPEE